MKRMNIPSLLLFTLALNLFNFIPLKSAQAAFNPFTAIKNRILPNKASQKLDSLLRCEMKIINEKRGEMDGLYFSLDSLEKAKEVLEDENRLADLNNDCEVFLAQTSELELGIHDSQNNQNNNEKLKTEYLETLKKLRQEKTYSETTLSYVESLVTPLIKCQAVTSNLVAGSGLLALSAGYGTGICTSTQGESFLMAVPNGGIHFGGGITISFVQQPIYFKLPKNRFHQGVYFTNVNAAVGLGLAADWIQVVEALEEVKNKLDKIGRTTPTKSEIAKEVLMSGNIRGIAIGLGSTGGLSMGEAFLFPLFYRNLNWSKSLLKNGFNFKEEMALQMGEISILNTMTNGSTTPTSPKPWDRFRNPESSESSERPSSSSVDSVSSVN